MEIAPVGTEVQITPTDSLQYGRATITSGATRIVPAAGYRTRSIALQNIGSVTCYVGDSAVSTVTGYRLTADSTVILDLDVEALPLYAITTAGTTDLSWIAVT